MAQAITLSSSTAPSAAINLNPYYNETVMQITVTSGSSGVIQVQVAVDDFNVPRTPTGAPGATVTWGTFALFNSSAADLTAGGAAGQTYTILSPLTGVRLAGTQSSAGGTFNTTATLKVLQSITA